MTIAMNSRRSAVFEASSALIREEIRATAASLPYAFPAKQIDRSAACRK
jgi:hypothetical protein